MSENFEQRGKEVAANAEKTEAEFRIEQADKVVNFLERIHAYDYAKKLLSGNEAMPKFEEFNDFLVRVNGMAREIPIAERKTDGENVQLSGIVESKLVPRHEDKIDLLRQAYDAIPNMEKEDVQYMLPAVINAVHLFADGNGRTSRVMHQLLKGYSSEEEFLSSVKTALGHAGRWQTADINPAFIDSENENIVLENHGWSPSELSSLSSTHTIFHGQEFRFAALEFRTIANDKELPISKDARNTLKLDSDNRHFFLTALYEVVGEDGVKKLITNEYERKNLISPKKMLEVLSDEDWKKLNENYYHLKKEAVENLIDLFVHPAEHPFAKRTLKDYFIGRIKRNYEDNQE